MRIIKRLSPFLVAYYGIIQALHFVILTGAMVSFSRTGSLGFPAQPPPDGWSVQTQAFLITTGAIDASNVVLVLIFVYGYFRHRPWCWTFGTISLTVVMYSVVLFTSGTVAASAWTAHPVGYVSIAVAYIPIFLLLLLYPHMKTMALNVE